MMDVMKFHSFESNINHVSNYNIINNTKNWIGRCPGDPPRQVNITDSSSSLQRKSLYRELSRHYSNTTIDSLVPLRIKQQQQQQRETSTREPLKATAVTTNSILSNVETTNTRLFNTLSKHISIKPEPLRPTNNLLNSALSSWQKYWTSTQIQRRRKEVNDSASNIFRPKIDELDSSTIHFVTVRDSSFQTTTDISNLVSRESSTIEIPSSTTKPLPERQPSLVKEEKPSFLPKILSPRPCSMTVDNNNQEKPMEKENTNISEDNEVNTLSTKIYKLPLPSTKPKVTKVVPKKGSRSKSLEKPPIPSSTLIEKKQPTSTSLPNTSSSKRKSEKLIPKTHRTLTKKQQQSLSKVMITTPRSKYELSKWDEPYVGVRYDPPTPPSSPSLFVWPQDSDQEEIEIFHEQ